VAALHFEFAVDSDVYPELYAVLASISSDPSRGERIRQLAASGLLWEAVRLHGAPLTAIAGISNTTYPELPLASKSNVRTRTRNVGRAVERRAPTPPSSSDLEEAAIDAVPTAEPSPLRPADSSPKPDRHRGASAPTDIPVLVDVIRFTKPSAPSGAPAPMRSFAPAVEAVPLQTAALAIARDIDEADEEIDQADVLAPVATLMHNSATRSRLLRMKEKGLFKNG